MSRQQLRIGVPIVIGVLSVIVTIAVLVAWNVIFTRYYLLVSSQAVDHDLGVGYWLILAFGCLFLVLVITVLIVGLVTHIRQTLYVRLQKSFIDSVTHELKSPLASIALGLDTLEMREMNNETRLRFLEIMRKDVDRLKSFIEHILEAGRLETKAAMRLESASIERLVQRCLPPVIARYGVKPEVFSLDLEHSGGTMVTDVVAMEIILGNLIDNAVKYSNREHLDVHVCVIQKSKRIHFLVKDKGVGIEPNQLKKIFGRFYRVDSQAHSSIRGTGLGLYVVKSLVKRLGGKIKASSKGVGMGTCFRLDFPSRLNPTP